MPRKGEKRKQQIIDTAKSMFIERGFQSTHIGQICDELNIARGTVYQYFSNKKEILISLFDSVIEQIKDALDQDDTEDFVKHHKSSSDVEEYLRAQFITTVGIILNEPIVIKLVFKDIQGMDQDVISIVNKSVLKIKSVVVGAIEKGISLKVFKSTVNADVTASMLIGGVMMLIYEYGKKNKDILGKETINAIVENYLNGAFSKSSK
jgi:TetR/AcrR family fatty acid metabolism transcriptional regulator